VGRLLPLGILVSVLGSGIAQAQEAATVRVTYYTDRGTTYSGSHTRPGVAACSWNYDLGTRLRFSDGREVVCEDRGRLGSAGWIDVWVSSPAEGRAGVALAYGTHATVEVIR
jgi:hypothetical protein